MKALILAAGYATRLYPLTREYPKALLHVNHKPIINHIVEKLARVEAINEIIVVTNSKFALRFRHWKRKLRLPKPVSIVDDLTKDNESRRGAIGDIEFAVTDRGITGDLLVIGGDNLFDSGLDEFLSFARSRRASPVVGAYNVSDKAHACRYGVISLDNLGRVADFKEKPKRPSSTLVAMCLYYFPKERLGLIKEYLGRRAGRHDATGSYIDWLRKKIPVYGFVFGGRWYDIGDHKFYNEAKQSFEVG